MKLRLVSRIIVLALVVVVGGGILLHNRTQAANSPASRGLQGTLLNDPAPTFTLRDQTGTSVSLAALRGRPVVLTFLYTHCPDACPLTAEKLHTAAQALGADATKVSWLAVSIDPAGDTPASATAFVAAHHLTGRLQFLLGGASQVSLIWNAYHIPVQPEPASPGKPTVVDHLLGLYLIDGAGRERVYMGDDFDPAVLSANLRLLMAG
ncbi:MAG TPA: SCO family protein [Acetobacteraceae bacterium]|nr:SCO family protein [Acetobacteraceae bacterium]